MSPIISPLVTSTSVNCRSNSGMDGLSRRGGRGCARGNFGRGRSVRNVGDFQANLQLSRAAVLVSDFRGQLDVVRLAVERGDCRGVFLSHEAAPDLARAGDL